MYVKYISLIIVVRTMAEGHQMVAGGHKTIMDGWNLFEEVVEEAGPGDLHQLLRQLKGKTTPTPPPTPMEVVQKHVEGAEGRPAPITLLSPC